MKHIGVLTSGGDSPGMNACVRAVVRTATLNGMEVTGFYRGYEGLMEDDGVALTRYDVRNIIHRGGTFLQTARSAEFRTPEGRAKAAAHLRQRGIDGLVVIGGDGSFTGAKILSEEHGIAVMGCPGTIDNDLFGTDYTIGYQTAVDTAVEAVDKIRDTAASHNRLFFVEVMGRDAGFIALRTGIAAGAEGVLIPETPTDLNRLVAYLQTDFQKKRRSGIIIVAEGDDGGGAYDVARKSRLSFLIGKRRSLFSVTRNVGANPMPLTAFWRAEWAMPRCWHCIPAAAVRWWVCKETKLPMFLWSKPSNTTRAFRPICLNW